MISRDAKKRFAATAELMRRGLIAGLFIIAGTTSAQTPDSDLFTVTEKRPAELERLNSDLVLRQRFVTIRADALFESGSIADILFLNLFDDVHSLAILDHFEQGDSGSWAWIGHVENIADSQVTLVINGPKVTGTVALLGQLYHIRHLEDDLHVVREIDVSAFPTDLRLLSSDDEALYAFASSWLAEENAVFDLVNEERAIHGVRPLSRDDRLLDAARAHSEDMATNDYFDHDSQDGRSPGTRILEAGYSWNTYGENIAYGYRSPESVMSGWMNSPGHRNNILNSSFCDLGVGFSEFYWTQDFGRKKGIFACPEEPVQEACWGDFDNDGDVDGSDLGVFSEHFGRTDCASGSPCAGDFDIDNDVDGTDLGAFSGDFGRMDCPTAN